MTWQAATTSYTFERSGDVYHVALIHQYEKASRRTKSRECKHKHRSKNSAMKCAERLIAQLDSQSARRAD